MKIGTKKMRQPKLGEMTVCGICHSDVKPIDKDWITYYKLVEKQGNSGGLYDQKEDKFLGYCGCEDKAIPEEPSLLE